MSHAQTRLVHLSLRLASFGACVILASPALADDEVSEKEQTPAETKRETPRAVRGEPAGSEPPTDHEQMVGHIAVGWYGVSDIPVGIDNNAVALASAPALGVRYWLNGRLGIDAALGLNLPGASLKSIAGNQTTVTDIPVPSGVLLHAGLPLAITTTKHAAFLVTPELNLGFGGSTEQANPAVMGDAQTTRKGFLLQLGARAGAEVHFGFMGIPNLSLEGSVGAYVNHLSASIEKGNSSTTFKQTSFGTTALNSPWDFFKSNVAARYYF